MKQNETDVRIMRESIKFTLSKLIVLLVLFLFTSPISIHCKLSIAKADVSTQKNKIHLFGNHFEIVVYLSCCVSPLVYVFRKKVINWL